MSSTPVFTIPQFQAALATQTASTLTEQWLARAQASMDAGDAIFATLTPARARQAALRVDAQGCRHALAGIPVSWKDVYDQSGEVTRLSSPTTARDAVKRHDAHAVALLESVGAVSLGRTTMTELALSGLGLNPHVGTPINAWSGQEALAPGGSSSGAALSVARGLVAYAMGSDTSGSIRIPAALNGLAGFRPTSMRLSRLGVWALAPTLDSIGPLAHTVADICTIMRAFAVDADAAASKPVRCIVPQGWLCEEVEPAIAADFENTLLRLQDAGVQLERRDVPMLAAPRALFAEYGALVGIEAWMMHREVLAQAACMDARVVGRLRAHSHFPPHHLAILLARRAQWQRELAQMLGDALLLLPTTAIDAPPLVRLAEDAAYFAECNQAILRNPMMASFLDLPALTLPTGCKSNGLPGALMVLGSSGCDEAVLAGGRRLAHCLTGDQAMNMQRVLSA